MKYPIPNRFLPVLAAAFMSVAAPVVAQAPQQVEVHFLPGTSGASYSETIAGHDTVEYYLTANAGQVMGVTLNTLNASNYFNVWAPGQDTALFMGSVEGTDFQGVLPSSGRYRVQVFLMRNAARRGESATYTINMTVDAGSAAVVTPAPEFADGNAGGPDWWEITLSSGGNLHIRSGPGRGYGVVTSLPSGSVVRNLGCQGTGSERWCQVDYGAHTGWALGQYLGEANAPSGNAPIVADHTPAPDYADGIAGGPDWWIVRNLSAGDRLNIRGGPSTNDQIVGQANSGTTLRNLGCRAVGQARWCEIQNQAGNLRGWVNARYLGESGPPTSVAPIVAAPAPVRPSATGNDVPELYLRPSGEYEVGFSTGCTLLFDPNGRLITGGSSCSSAQSIRAQEAVAAYRREQGQ